MKPGEIWEPKKEEDKNDPNWPFYGKIKICSIKNDSIQYKYIELKDMVGMSHRTLFLKKYKKCGENNV